MDYIAVTYNENLDYSISQFDEILALQQQEMQESVDDYNALSQEVLGIRTESDANVATVEHYKKTLEELAQETNNASSN